MSAFHSVQCKLQTSGESDVTTKRTATEVYPASAGCFLFYANGGELMAKGKYIEWLEPDGLLRIAAWARDGLIEEQIAHNMGITRSTLSEWKNRFPDIGNALKRNKEIVDIEVENALLQKARGITKIVRKPIKVKEVIYENGKRLKETEHVEYADEEIYIPPDTTAQIFWLKNRRPDLWRDKQTVDLSADKNLLEAVAEVERMVNAEP